MYNQYNPEANVDSSNFLKKILEVFRSFLFSEDISKGSIRSYVSDVRHFLGWLLFFLEANRVLDVRSLKCDDGQRGEKWDTFPLLLKHINQKVLNAYKDYLVSNNVPLKTINRRFSSLRRFGLFCQSQNWSSLNPFETLKNVSLNQPFPETKYHLAEYRAHLWKNNSSKATIKNYLNDIRQFLVWMERSSR